jgi:hypothetical protein
MGTRGKPTESTHTRGPVGLYGAIVALLLLCAGGARAELCAFCDDFLQVTRDAFVVNATGRPSAAVVFTDFLASDPEVASIVAGESQYRAAFGTGLEPSDGCRPAFGPVGAVDGALFGSTWNPARRTDKSAVVETTLYFHNGGDGYWNLVVHRPIDYFGYGKAGDEHNEYYVGRVSYGRVHTTEGSTGMWVRSSGCVAVYIDGTRAAAWCGSPSWVYTEAASFVGSSIAAGATYVVDVFFASVHTHVDQPEGLWISDLGTPTGTECVHAEIPTACATSDGCFAGYACVCGACTRCDPVNVCDAVTVTPTGCVHEAVMGCCLDNADCPTDRYCPANHSCTHPACEPIYCRVITPVNHVCAYSLAPGCCVTSSDCAANNACVDGLCKSCVANNTCDTVAILPTSCVHTPKPGCCLTNATCADAEYCDPAHVCAAVVCPPAACSTSAVESHRCHYARVPGCCISSTECGAAEACVSSACAPCVSANACDSATIGPTNCTHDVVPGVAGCCLTHGGCQANYACEFHQCVACEPAAQDGCDIATVDPVLGCVHTRRESCITCALNDDCPANNACIGYRCVPCVSTLCGESHPTTGACEVTIVTENIGEICDHSAASEKYCSTTGLCVEYQECAQTSDCPSPGYVCLDNRCQAVTMEFVARHGVGGTSPLLSIDTNRVWTMAVSLTGAHKANKTMSAFWSCAGRDGTEERVAHHATDGYYDPLKLGTNMFSDLRCRGPSDCTPTTDCTKQTLCTRGVCSYDGVGNATTMTPCRVGVSKTEPDWGYGLCNGAGVCEKDIVTQAAYVSPTQCQQADPIAVPCKAVGPKTVHQMKYSNNPLYTRYACNYSLAHPKGTPCTGALVVGGAGYCTASGDCVPFCDPYQTPGCCSSSSQCPAGQACVAGTCTPCADTLCGTAEIQPNACVVTPIAEMVGEVCELSVGTEKYCSTGGLCVAYQPCASTAECPQPGYVCEDSKCVALTREYVAQHGVGSPVMLASHTGGGFVRDGTYVWNLASIQIPEYGDGAVMAHGDPDPTSGFWSMAGGDSTINLALAIATEKKFPLDRIHTDITPADVDFYFPGRGIIVGDLRCRGPSDCTPGACAAGFFGTPLPTCTRGVCGTSTSVTTRKTSPCNGGLWTTNYGVCSSTDVCVSGDPASSDPSDCPPPIPTVSPCRVASKKTLRYVSKDSTPTYYCDYVLAPKGTACTPSLTGGSGFCTALGDCVSL